MNAIIAMAIVNEIKNNLLSLLKPIGIGPIKPKKENLTFFESLRPKNNVLPIIIRIPINIRANPINMKFV